MTDKTAKYRTEIQQMMYVSGETAEASPETTGMIEEIVRQQVIEMVSSIPRLTWTRSNASSYDNAQSKPPAAEAAPSQQTI